MLVNDIKDVKEGMILTKDAQPKTTISIIVTDPDGSLMSFLKGLARHANPGHSFSVIMDPEGDHKEIFGFDGDGSFRVVSINGSKDFKTNDGNPRG